MAAGMKETALLLLIMGVASLRVVYSEDQSEEGLKEKQPIGELPDGSGGRVATPEVVLQLKYDRGALDRIYLAQYRQGKKIWMPSVKGRTTLCSDLCHAGLGGDSCGPICKDLVPVGLQTTLHQHENSSEIPSEEVQVGTPRRYVCPVLCANHLGEPLCDCELIHQSEDSSEENTTDWSAVCSAFCQEDAYILPGCPPCSSVSAPNLLSPRILTTSDGWAAWCNVQCRQGQGGAACNCDRTPFQ